MIQLRRKWFVYLFCFLFSGSCSLFQNDEDCDPAPYDCIDVKPAEGILILQITLDNLNSVVPVVIYSGDIEDNHVVLIDSVNISSIAYRLPNNDYSARAEYKLLKNSQRITVYVVDGGNLDATSTEYCEGDCYEEGELELDITLDPDLFD